MDPVLARLRAHAVSHSLFVSATLRDAVQRLGFIQADPIRSPARAQDLILRHRVDGYKAGDLDRLYHSLDIEEDYFGNYGFVARDVWRLLHPRKAAALSKIDRKVLDAVAIAGRHVHPNDLEASFGRAKVVNAWGGNSKATKCALEKLHFQGYLRVARREKGIRVYESIVPPSAVMTPVERLERLILVIVNQLAPVPERTLQSIASILRRRMDQPAENHRKLIRALVDTGKLESEIADSIRYVMPPSMGTPGNADSRVRFLAPFDPIVWDRRRFEHFWGWSYRFEAYTPPARRIRGYYAMPLLWGDKVIGWANASVPDGRKLSVDIGYQDRKPAAREFKRELDAEIARLEEFLG